MNTIDFLAKWVVADGTERSNAQLFLTELCELLELPKPEPAKSDSDNNAYVFERRVLIAKHDGSRDYPDSTGCWCRRQRTRWMNCAA